MGAGCQECSAAATATAQCPSCGRRIARCGRHGGGRRVRALMRTHSVGCTGTTSDESKQGELFGAPEAEPNEPPKENLDGQFELFGE